MVLDGVTPCIVADTFMASSTSASLSWRQRLSIFSSSFFGVVPSGFSPSGRDLLSLSGVLLRLSTHLLLSMFRLRAILSPMTKLPTIETSTMHRSLAWVVSSIYFICFVVQSWGCSPTSLLRRSFRPIARHRGSQISVLCFFEPISYQQLLELSIPTG